MRRGHGCGEVEARRRTRRCSLQQQLDVTDERRLRRITQIDRTLWRLMPTQLFGTRQDGQEGACAGAGATASDGGVRSKEGRSSGRVARGRGWGDGQAAAAAGAPCVPTMPWRAQSCWLLCRNVTEQCQL